MRKSRYREVKSVARSGAGVWPFVLLPTHRETPWHTGPPGPRRRTLPARPPARHVHTLPVHPGPEEREDAPRRLGGWGLARLSPRPRPSSSPHPRVGTPASPEPPATPIPSSPCEAGRTYSLCSVGETEAQREEASGPEPCREVGRAGLCSPSARTGPLQGPRGDRPAATRGQVKAPAGVVAFWRG